MQPLRVVLDGGEKIRGFRRSIWKKVPLYPDETGNNSLAAIQSRSLSPKSFLSSRQRCCT